MVDKGALLRLCIGSDVDVSNQSDSNGLVQSSERPFVPSLGKGLTSLVYYTGLDDTFPN